MRYVLDISQHARVVMERLFEHFKAFAAGLKAFFSSPEMFYRMGARGIVKLVYRTNFVDFEKYIPETGPAILISNHISYMDGLIIHAAVKNRRVYYVIDKEIYEVPPVKYFMDMCGCIPIEPKKESVTKALERVGEVLQDGHIVTIFPEGWLSRTGNLRRFRFGVEWMAHENKVPVIPMAIRGLWGSIFSRKDSDKWYRWIPRTLFRKVSAICGEPIPWQEAKINLLQRKVMELKDREI